MKLAIVFCLAAWMLAAEEPAKKVAPPAPVPASAVKSVDGSYRYTDPQGKQWIYRQTPFGMAHYEDRPVETREEAMKRFANMTATADGDTIRFERPGPFGVYKWQRKKTELDETEQMVWNREQARAAAK